MPTATSPKRRAYDGPALLSLGFRPFFLFAALWAVFSLAIWVLVISGSLALPSGMTPADWHAHEMIFGYSSAVVCGFLLTAIPNWTGRLPVMGRPLGSLAAVWVLGRLAVTFGGALPAWVVALSDLAFLALLVAIIAREILAGGNKRNLPVVLICLTFLAANGLFHWQALGGHAAGSVGARLGMGALIALLSLIGGRIVPSFTRNWLAKRRSDGLPIAANRFDMAVIGVTVVTLTAWVAVPDLTLTGIGLALTGALHLARVARWSGHRTAAEPLVLVLHIAYLSLPLGFIFGALGHWSNAVPPQAGIHIWMIGGVGLMTLAVMTRASLGHSGRELRAGWVEMAIYALILLALAFRLVAIFGGPPWTLTVSGSAWAGAFGLFAVAYWPILTRPRIAPRRPQPAPGKG